MDCGKENIGAKGQREKSNSGTEKTKGHLQPI